LILGGSFIFICLVEKLSSSRAHEGLQRDGRLRLMRIMINELGNVGGYAFKDGFLVVCIQEDGATMQ
jgi:hypothetical protein